MPPPPRASWSSTPPSRTSSPRPSTRWPCSWPRPATSRRPTPPSWPGRWERSKWEGVELADKTLGIVGLGRIGKLVAQRALAFGMRVVAHDPFVAPERARQINVDLLEPRRAGGGGRLPHPPRREDARDARHDQQRAPGQGQAQPAHHQRLPRRRRSTRRHWPTPSGRAASAGPPSTCSPPSRPPSRRCSRCRRSWSPRTSGPAPPRPRTRPATPSPSRWAWRWPASSCPSR